MVRWRSAGPPSNHAGRGRRGDEPAIPARWPAPERKRAAVALGRAEEGIVTGYASLFEAADLSGDIVAPGAFAKSLARRGVAGIRMLWQHLPEEPIGRWLDLREDARGLLVAGRIATDTTRGRDVAALIRAGAVDGLSIGFRTVRAEPRPGRTGRRLLEIDLWEISIVTFPMLPGARLAPLGALGDAGLLRGAATRLTTRFPVLRESAQGDAGRV